ncbi:protein of unknown function DUF1470 [Methylocella silvestris BL2]|uniref:Zinc finger CGNR domain-containing protein n=1 Tax=Methylocella silvestris (strain DSM 15510 / CIP 108128 / LMG 27833 / NCIMB 13906 / BL2) TaxID=395965 RepID=B8EM95_METSB|nr:ABATE domain-containing protein [Methylocella silvestris]ACK51484.1 protein of unknown function DUF1470 [Methylocella silvestris BL2]
MTAPPKIPPEPHLIGGHLAIDFLNSITADRIEWLGSGADFLVWLEKSGAIDAGACAEMREGGIHRLDPIAARARNLREQLRALLSDLSVLPQADQLSFLNELLAEDESRARLVIGTNADGAPRFQIERVPALSRHDQLLQPLAWAIADLLCNEDLSLLRRCEGAVCSLMFIDRTKSHARRWCSMAVCGNRAKAAAHRARTRG